MLSKLSPTRATASHDLEEEKEEALPEQIASPVPEEVATLRGQLQAANIEQEQLKEEIRLLRAELDSAREQGYICNSQQAIHRHLRKHNTTM